ncbi:MAG: hypothetical protein WC829_01935 [Hyphomicrobium sp.]
MKIRLKTQQGKYPAGSVHHVLEVIPHGGHTDSAKQYRIAGYTYVASDNAEELVAASDVLAKLAELRGCNARLCDELNDLHDVFDKASNANFAREGGLEIANGQLKARIAALETQIAWLKSELKHARKLG